MKRESDIRMRETITFLIHTWSVAAFYRFFHQMLTLCGTSSSQQHLLLLLRSFQNMRVSVLRPPLTVVFEKSPAAGWTLTVSIRDEIAFSSRNVEDVRTEFLSARNVKIREAQLLPSLPLRIPWSGDSLVLLLLLFLL